MNKTPRINRLFLATVIWALASSFLIGFFPFVYRMSRLQLMALSQLLYFLPVLVFLVVHKINPAEWMPFKRLPLSVIGMIVLYALLLLPMTTLLNLISMLFVKNALAGAQAELSAGSVWLNLLVIGLLPAVCEEFTFRGLYYNGYRQRGVWCAILGSAFAFGLMHLNFNQFCYAFALGVAFGLLLEATGSIFATMTAHFVVNGWNVVLMAITASSGSAAGEQAEAAAEITIPILLSVISVYMVLAAVCTCLAAAVLYWIAKRCGRIPHMKWCFRRRMRRRKEPRTMFTPAFVAAFVIALVYMIAAG